jgi:hypothetical protein
MGLADVTRERIKQFTYERELATTGFSLSITQG